MTAVNYLPVFQGAKRRGNTLAVLPKRATQENGQRETARRVAAHSYRNSLNAVKSVLP